MHCHRPQNPSSTTMHSIVARRCVSDDASFKVRCIVRSSPLAVTSSRLLLVIVRSAIVSFGDEVSEKPIVAADDGFFLRKPIVAADDGFPQETHRRCQPWVFSGNPSSPPTMGFLRKPIVAADGGFPQETHRRRRRWVSESDPRSPSSAPTMELGNYCIVHCRNASFPSSTPTMGFMDDALHFDDASVAPRARRM
jgi:hypothetical protein